MPSIRFRAPLLALSDMVTLAVLTLGERRAGQTSCQDGEGLGHTRTVIRLPTEEAHDARRPAHQTVPRPFPRHPRTPGGGRAGSGRPRPGCLARATRGLVTGNAALCGAVVAGDDEVDRRYLDIERQVVDLLGRHAPVGSDRRLLTAILHINLHLERIGDTAVNVAGSARWSPTPRGAGDGPAAWRR